MTLPDEYYECPFCEGTGELTSSFRAPGSESDAPDKYECGYCEGTGKLIPNEDKPEERPDIDEVPDDSEVPNGDR